MPELFLIFELNIFCIAAQTCCPGTDSSEYGCCAIPDGVCCPSRTYCCPHGSYCDESENACILQDSNQPFNKRLGEVLEDTAADIHLSSKDTYATEDVNLCDDQHYCHNSMTCCQSPDGHSCCPFADAVCCPDMVHCCPSNQQCDSSSKRCVEKKTRPALIKKHVNVLE